MILTHSARSFPVSFQHYSSVPPAAPIAPLSHFLQRSSLSCYTNALCRHPFGVVARNRAAFAETTHVTHVRYTFCAGESRVSVALPEQTRVPWHVRVLVTTWLVGGISYSRVSVLFSR